MNAWREKLLSDTLYAEEVYKAQKELHAFWLDRRHPKGIWKTHAKGKWYKDYLGCAMIYKAIKTEADLSDRTVVLEIIRLNKDRWMGKNML